MDLADRLKQYALLMRLHRPIGALLLGWPALWALWFAAGGAPDGKILAVFLFGILLTRSAGCVINDYADRDFDPHVARTRDRPIARGRVAPREALVLFVLVSLTAFGLVLLLNPLTVALSVIGAALTVTYPFLKRHTHLPQFYLGLAFGWAIPMAFAAVLGTVPPLAWVLFAADIFWCVAFDTEYAMVDRADDLRIGVKSTAILFGDYDRAAVGAAHAATLGLLVVAGLMAKLGVLYYVGLTIAAGIALYQQRLIRDRRPERCWRAFLNNNWFGAAVFAGVALSYLVENRA